MHLIETGAKRLVNLKRTQREFSTVVAPTHLNETAGSFGSAETRAGLIGLGVDFRAYEATLILRSEEVRPMRFGLFGAFVAC
ncbi:hypothetical protein [Methyloterricola oryzae]|uniref:hypothetical protein n=1 Tax=Methyloterricola oryzae TaxID=1495050 RepID=UPI0005EBD6C4|nr:hypothetical protein [Methyloterricola oryzae]